MRGCCIILRRVQTRIGGASEGDVVCVDYKLLCVSSGKDVKDIPRNSGSIRLCELDHCQLFWAGKFLTDKTNRGI